MENAKQMRLLLPVALVATRGSHGGRGMLIIGRIPRKTSRVFAGLAGHLGRPTFRHFCLLTVAMTTSHGATIDRMGT